jgi:hypothetical protein
MGGGDRKPARVLPLTDGYFEVALPSAFCEGSPKAIPFTGSTSAVEPRPAPPSSDLGNPLRPVTTAIQPAGVGNGSNGIVPPRPPAVSAILPFRYAFLTSDGRR